MKGLRADDTRVVDVRWEERDDSSGRAAVFIVLVLADPPAGRITWPVENVTRLKRAVQDKLVEREPDFDKPWFVELEPEHPEELEPDDAHERIDVDAA